MTERKMMFAVLRKDNPVLDSSIPKGGGLNLFGIKGQAEFWRDKGVLQDRANLFGVYLVEVINRNVPAEDLQVDLAPDVKAALERKSDEEPDALIEAIKVATKHGQVAAERKLREILGPKPETEPMDIEGYEARDAEETVKKIIEEEDREKGDRR